MWMEVIFQNGDFLEGHCFSSYLNMEIMLQSRYICIHKSDEFFRTS